MLAVVVCKVGDERGWMVFMCMQLVTRLTSKSDDVNEIRNALVFGLLCETGPRFIDSYLILRGDHDLDVLLVDVTFLEIG